MKKEYFSYGAFAVCLINAVIRPDLFSVLLAGITLILVILDVYFSESAFRKSLRQAIARVEHEAKQSENFIEKRLEETLRRVEELEKLKTEFAETKRVVRDINLANTFVPRAKRNAEL